MRKGMNGVPILMLLLGMILTIIIVVFALQNGQVVTVGFFDWRVEASLVLVIILSALMGFFAALFFELFVQIKLRYRLYKANKQLKKMEEEIAALKNSNIAQTPVLAKPVGTQEARSGESATII